MSVHLLLLTFAAFLLESTAQYANTKIRIVDLGTSIHQATFNETGRYFNFSNIGYAEPPLGNLRFRKSIPPLTVNRTINDGSEGRICPQGNAAWLATAFEFVSELITGLNTTNGSAPGPPSGPSGGGSSTSDPRESEDCLLLDVMVPESVFNAPRTRHDPGAPVLLWIHGGGHVTGAKDLLGNPAGLIAENIAGGRAGIVYVQINYRLGLFGYPPRFPRDHDIASNSELFGQRLALEWVQNNIYLFGGNPDSVTVIGESAGAGRIMHQITAFGGKNGPAPFKRGIAQSPAWRPASDAALYEQVYHEFLAVANVSSIQEARNLSSAQLQEVNQIIVSQSAFGAFTFGTNIDGDFQPEAPEALLAQGKFDPNVQLIISHNSDEGLLFTDPSVQNQSAFESNMRGLLPSVDPAKISYIAEVLYPEDFSGVRGYTTQTERLTLAEREPAITCNAFVMDEAYGNLSRSYQFSVFPGAHAQDVGYTFFNGPALDLFGLPVNSTIAQTMQRFIVDFTISGHPNAAHLAPALDVYGSRAIVLDLNMTGFRNVSDPTANARCKFWNQGLYSKDGFLSNVTMKGRN